MMALPPFLAKEFSQYIVVDVETAGPNPSTYALLSIGACTLQKPPGTFYAELQPDQDAQDLEAMAIHRLDFSRLQQEGLPPALALQNFADWLEGAIPQGEKPIFVAFNAAFDWMFINEYFLRYLGQNPFGHAPLDIKALYMGVKGVAWQQTSMRYMRDIPLKHNALQDALDQADLFLEILGSMQ